MSAKTYTHASEIKLLAALTLMLFLGVSCGFSGEIQPTASQRDFSRSDLLLPLSALPGWEMDSSEISDLAPGPLGMRHNMGGSSLSFLRTGISGVEQLVVQFPSTSDSARAYRSHDFTRNTSTSRWEPLDGFDYVIRAADQFRVVCEDNVQASAIEVVHCDIEAQFDEFISIVFYSGLSHDTVISDLTLIAKAIDDRMASFGLGK
jgi:hypothetical protein